MIKSRNDDSDAPPESSSYVLSQGLKSLANDITLLYRISNTIRRASKENQNSKAIKSFRIKDDEGNDAEEQLQQVYSSYILGKFPSMRDSLRDRIAASMVLRRKRILYRRARYRYNPIKAAKLTPQPMIEAPKVSLPQETIMIDVADISPETISNTIIQPSQSKIQSLAFSATTLAAEDYKKASVTPSVVSATKTVALGNHEDLIFPLPPTGGIRRKYNMFKHLRPWETQSRTSKTIGKQYLDQLYATITDMCDYIGNHARRVSSPSSANSSRSSSRSRSNSLTIRSEYPKNGKTRIPSRLVSRRALIDIGYAYMEEVRLSSNSSSRF